MSHPLTAFSCFCPKSDSFTHKFVNRLQSIATAEFPILRNGYRTIEFSKNILFTMNFRIVKRLVQCTLNLIGKCIKRIFNAHTHSHTPLHSLSLFQYNFLRQHQRRIKIAGLNSAVEIFIINYDNGKFALRNGR